MLPTFDQPHLGRRTPASAGRLIPAPVYPFPASLLLSIAFEAGPSRGAGLSCVVRAVLSGDLLWVRQVGGTVGPVRPPRAVIALSPDGDPTWRNGAGPSGGGGVALYPGGGIVLTGGFVESLTLGDTMLHNTSAPARRDMVLARYGGGGLRRTDARRGGR